ncbi:SRPBCC family protein [Flagellimonas hymeniacidonis]|uniref:SRPBCC family protein n=1 Tax=Flagellimonas hymeniacidonis TaxID=2603628 RepID=A0A5C8V2E0_9FLAO|nr:SRPBCC family protein [Flagellimonas hymeniacidonis]TXN35923.1 SRPBCC family protein [Flagellimonas hymeniacidonis]
MKVYQLRSKQVLPISKKEAWNFLSNPANLKTITPDHMGFHILSGDDRPMYAGQIIQYIVQPFPFFRTKWVTEITHVIDGEYFVDEQRFGPYALWHHKHFLKKTEQGVEMEDIIDYKIPFGILGQLFQPILVKKQLLQIFQYREQKLAELFGKVDGEPNTLELISI